MLDVAISVVVAPAGYGKSTALGEWYQSLRERAVRAAWLTVDGSDNDPFLFSSHLISTIDRNIPELRGGSLAIVDFRLDVDLRTTAAAIVNAVEALQQPVILILDDVHEISERGVLDLISLLANSGSRFLHLVISARSQPQIRLAKLRALGELAEFAARDFRFDRDEAQQLLAKTAPGLPASELLDHILQHTEGWVVGLKLAAMSLRHETTSDLPQMTSASSFGVEQFLQDEVLGRLPDAVSQFVLEVATIREFSAELCDSVLDRRDSAAMIDDLEAQQLFISRVGQPGWFRFHQLFADAATTIMSRRQPGREAELHQRAAEWFAGKGFPVRAVRHAFATGNPAVAVGLLDRVAHVLVQSGRGATVVRYGGTLPHELVDDHPGLQLEQVYALTLSWQFRDAKRMLRDVRANLTNGARAARWQSEGLDLEQIMRKQVYCEMQFAILRDEMVEAEALARQWLAMPGAYTAFDDAVSQTSLLYAQREQYDCRSIAASGQARETFLSLGNRWGSIWHDCIVGASYTQLGQLARARAIYEGAFATAVDVVGRTNPTTAMPALHLSEILYETDDLHGASSLVEEFLPLAAQTGLVDQLVAGYQTKVRLAAIVSLPAALKVLDEGEEIAISRDFPRLQACLMASRMSVLAAAGEAPELRRIGTLNNLLNNTERFLPARGMTTSAAARAFAAAHVALVDNRLNGADTLLSKWLRHLTDHGFLRLAVRFALLLAHVQIVMGDAKAAHRTLRIALQSGAKGGAIRSFVDANAAVRSQIESMQLSLSGIDAELIDHHARILAAMGSATARANRPATSIEDLGGRYDALNDRESELLLLIATGLMNSQIADQTGLTLGTVKWYLQQIYAKLGVNRRSEAVFKARQLGIIG